MSVRVHAIAKEVNKTSKELIEILTERGYDIKSASSTIDKITAQSIIDEFTLEASNETEDNNSKNENSVAKKEEDSPKESKKKLLLLEVRLRLRKRKEKKKKQPKLRKRVRLSKKDKTYQFLREMLRLFHHHQFLVLLHHHHLLLLVNQEFPLHHKRL